MCRCCHLIDLVQLLYASNWPPDYSNNVIIPSRYRIPDMKEPLFFQGLLNT